MSAWKPFFIAVVPLVWIGACGGSTDDDNSTGGTSSGGTSSGGTSSGGTSSGGTQSGGSGGCGNGGGADCVDPCTGQFSSPVCVDGGWTCNYESCPDASPGGSGGTAGGGGSGGTGACPANQVPTQDGCLTCDAATLAYSNAITAAQKTNSACQYETDCVLTAASTTCSGACPIAVSKAGEAAFQTELEKIDKGYCSGFVPVCGYSTPKCANAKLACNNGTCEAVFN